MPNKKAREQAQLRQSAVERLIGGSAPPHAGAAGLDALTMLHGLASDPVRASDALKVLHELQVHQVELDLQREQAEQDYRELGAVLERYTGLFEFAPMAYFVVDKNGRIIEANHAGAGLFEVAQDEMAGQMIDSFVAPASQPAVAQLLHSLQQSTSTQRCCVLGTNHSDERAIQVVANVAPGGTSVLLACVDITDRGPTDATA